MMARMSKMRMPIAREASHILITTSVDNNNFVDQDMFSQIMSNNVGLQIKVFRNNSRINKFKISMKNSQLSK